MVKPNQFKLAKILCTFTLHLIAANHAYCTVCRKTITVLKDANIDDHFSLFKLDYRYDYLELDGNTLDLIEIS
jgi:hypothetical protein